MTIHFHGRGGTTGTQALGPLGAAANGPLPEVARAARFWVRQNSEAEAARKGIDSATGTQLSAASKERSQEMRRCKERGSGSPSVALAIGLDSGERHKPWGQFARGGSDGSIHRKPSPPTVLSDAGGKFHQFGSRKRRKCRKVDRNGTFGRSRVGTQLGLFRQFYALRRHTERLREVHRPTTLMPTHVIAPIAATTIRPAMREYSSTCPPRSSLRARRARRMMRNVCDPGVGERDAAFFA